MTKMKMNSESNTLKISVSGPFAEGCPVDEKNIVFKAYSKIVSLLKGEKTKITEIFKKYSLGHSPTGEPDYKIYEIGILIKSAFWGKGFGEEAAQTVIDYAFTVLRASSLFAVHNIANTHSKPLLLKLGFHYSHEEYSVSTGQHDPSYTLIR